MNSQLEPLIHRILVVDDNPSIHEDFRKILCPGQSQSGAAVASMVEELFGDAPQPKPIGGFEMDSAFQGQEALAKVQAAEQEGRPYSLAFMDVRMPPGWDGVETIARIWKEYPHIQVVICTAYSDCSWEQILHKLGETDSLVILKKPFDNVEVLQLAHTLTKKWTMTRQANARMADLNETVRQRTRELLEANQNLQSEIQRRSLIERALRESEERFHKAFETVSVALGIRPLDAGRFIDVNQSFVALSGYSKQDLLGKTLEELNLLEAPGHYAELIQSLQNGKQVRNADLRIRRKNGEIRQTLVSVEFLRLGEQSCLLAALLDVTDQKQLEAQLRQSQKMEALGQLAAGVAHDFNNLLTVIHGHTTLQLAKSNLDADIAKAFTQVKLASERAAALTRQLLAFTRQQIVQRKPLDLRAAISQMQSLLCRTLGETVQLECQLAPHLPCIHADESNLDQIIMNLAVNARDAMPNGGKLSLSTGLATVTAAQAAGHPEKRAGSFVVLTVADTGCGMDRETLGRIFEPFFTTKPIGRGTGLGLSTVYGITKQHEGWLEVESQPGVGTTFRVFLPTTDQQPQPGLAARPGKCLELSPASECKPEAPKASELKPDETILVVEDEPDVREFMTSALTAKGYKVVQATSGAEALLKWKDTTRKVRLLLTDMVMPGGLNGSALAKHLLRRQPELKVVYTSGYSPDVVANGHALKEGVNFLAKPFTQDRLLATVRYALDSHSLPLQLVPAATGS